MKWFDRWFANKCRWAWEQAREPSPDFSNFKISTTASPGIPYNRSNSLNSAGLELTIYGADGGTILEFRQYDVNRDRCNYSLHVISSSDNFEERIAQAITMEMLKRGIN
jgi:hypothetical protein